MPSNEQRRAAAKRKLERQLARRAEQEKKRKRLTIAGSVLGVIVVAAAGVGVYFLTKGEDGTPTASETTNVSTKKPQEPGVLPALPTESKTVTCAYPTGAEPAAKPVTPPTETSVAAGPDAPRTTVTIDSTQGPIGLELDSTGSPCTVNSFVSLARQGYFDNTECHRISAQQGFEMLQCGDPTASSQGGPGYAFANEYPTDQYDPSDPALNSPVTYKRGVIAMANSGLTPEGTNGSQFFLVFGDTTLPPKYTIFGTIDEPGLQTLAKVGAEGDDGSNPAGGGKPKLPISFNTVKVG
ncbi:peptidylprolyl isomerase [Nocardia caishijiensis]|uniref:Peptidyl-prolyl cis-trans isomerase B (Cyclophilin B) n=1 Tax=Nocardia caishijiensis TaxID=184756 RepID=A0ABQ6YNX6_9NOCA|nr:peptidylprolyl isomerase [Nocardia caishijiensis]KAF0847494.1 peptidyl-prolyl cis-trans isomerase B (cyclophilin B) [Nocardia caishijiensis]